MNPNEEAITVLANLARRFERLFTPGSTGTCMATETADGSETADSSSDTGDPENPDNMSPYMRGVTITTIATVMGMVAAVVSSFVATANGDPDSFTGVLVMIIAIIVQFPIYKLLGIDVEAFGTKDQLYIFFMTFVLWFVSWTILLTTGALH